MFISGGMPFRERFDVIKSGKNVRILKDKIMPEGKNYAIQTNWEIYPGYNEKGAYETYSKFNPKDEPEDKATSNFV